MPKRPHKLDLYRLSVQGPQQEVEFFLKAHAHYARKRGTSHTLPTRLKEDFCGTAAVASTWVGMDENHRAIGLDLDVPTLKWAQRRADRVLDDRAGDLHLIMGDVREMTPPLLPKVDIVTATNFSTFFWKTRQAMRDYFKVARKCLDTGGLLIIDAYGGQGGFEEAEWSQTIKPPKHEGIAPFKYIWEQKSFDPVTHHTDCRIHFEIKGQKRWSDVFRYDWRLWTLPELTELMLEAGFAEAQVWADRWDTKSDDSDGIFRPTKKLDAREDWVAYIVGVK